MRQRIGGHRRRRPDRFLIFVEAAERVGAGGTQLRQRLGFDPADVLAGDVEVAADLFERVVRCKPDPQPHPQDAFLARRQRGEEAKGTVG